MTPRSRRVVLFDLDGTLVDSREDIVEAFASAAGRLRPGHALEASSVEALIGWPLADMAARLGLGLAEAEVALLEDAYRARFDALGGGRTRVHEGVRELLEALPPRELAVVSAKLERQAAMVLERVSLARHFAHVQGWAPGRRHKPHPELVHLALERLGARHEEAVLVGDTEADVLAGRAAGVLTIAVTWGFGARSALEAAGPSHLVESAEGLRRLLE